MKLFRGLFILVLSTTIYFAFAADSDKGNNMLQGKPFFMIGINISGCAYDVRINDVTIMDDKKGFPVSVDMPVNEWIVSGKNQLSIHIRPIGHDTDISTIAEGSATLLVRQSGTPIELNQPISRLAYSHSGVDEKSKIINSTTPGKYDSNNKFISSAEGDVIVGEVAIKISADEKEVIITQDVEFYSSLPKWAWTDSDIIPNTEDTRKQLIKEYQQIWNLLNSKDVKEKIIPQFTERTKELAQGYYVGEIEMVPMDLEKSPFNPELELAALYEDRSYLKISANGRLATLLHDWNDDAMIIYRIPEKNMMETYDITFRKSGAKWIITR